MDREENYEFARGLLVDFGTIEECKNHSGTFFDGDGDLEKAYRIANSRITSGQISLPTGLSRRDFTDLLKSVYEDNSALDGCPECDENFGPD